MTEALRSIEEQKRKLLRKDEKYKRKQDDVLFGGLIKPEDLAGLNMELHRRSVSKETQQKDDEGAEWKAFRESHNQDIFLSPERLAERRKDPKPTK